MIKSTKHGPGLEQVLDPGPVSKRPSVSVYSSVEWVDDGALPHAVRRDYNNHLCLNVGSPKALLLRHSADKAEEPTSPAHARGSDNH